MGIWHHTVPSWESASEPVHTWGQERQSRKGSMGRGKSDLFCLYFAVNPGSTWYSQLLSEEACVGGPSRGWNIRQIMAYCPEPLHLNLSGAGAKFLGICEILKMAACMLRSRILISSRRGQF